jgi:glycosyltransferase involved in cell wall biosynthesis
LKYSIIIPAYNERLRIAEGLDKVLAHVRDRGLDAEIIVVNDGSRDETPEIVRGYMKQHSNIRLLENPGNRGKGYSVRHGMMEARGDVLLLTDADLSAPIYESKKLFAAIEDGADVAVGSRWQRPGMQTRRQPSYRRITGRIFNGLNRIFLGLRLKDTQCGFKAFTREAAHSIFPTAQVDRWGWDPEVLFLANRLNYRVAEIPVEWAHDDRSKINPIRDGFSIVLDMLRVRWFHLRGDYAGLKRVSKAQA